MLGPSATAHIRSASSALGMPRRERALQLVRIGGHLHALGYPFWNFLRRDVALHASVYRQPVPTAAKLGAQIYSSVLFSAGGAYDAPAGVAPACASCHLDVASEGTPSCHLVALSQNLEARAQASCDAWVNVPRAATTRSRGACWPGFAGLVSRRL